MAPSKRFIDFKKELEKETMNKFEILKMNEIEEDRYCDDFINGLKKEPFVLIEKNNIIDNKIPNESAELYSPHFNNHKYENYWNHTIREKQFVLYKQKQLEFEF